MRHDELGARMVAGSKAFARTRRRLAKRRRSPVGHSRRPPQWGARSEVGALSEASGAMSQDCRKISCTRGLHKDVASASLEPKWFSLWRGRLVSRSGKQKKHNGKSGPCGSRSHSSKPFGHTQPIDNARHARRHRAGLVRRARRRGGLLSVLTLR